MTPEELKKSILQLAIQGKLVEQRPEEGTADDLYAQIQAEKQRLIKEGKIKKEKPLLEIIDDEIPFEIPETWKWIRVGAIEEINLGFTYRPEYTDEGVYFLSVKDISSGFIDFSNAKKVSQETYDNASYGSKPRRGDILFGRVGTMGKPQIIDVDIDFCIFVSLGFFRDHTDIMNKQYISFWMQSSLFDKQVDANVKGSAQKNLNTGWLKDFLLPLPPLEEQERIVARIEELLPLVDKYADAYNRLEELNKTFPGDLKKSILQYAIQGKLVEQRPEEGSADDLYAQIQAEKQKLIKEGKIKKEKPLPEITDDEIPFDIPESWKWVRIQTIGLYFADGPFGSNLKTAHYTSNPEVRIIQLSNIGEDGWKDKNVKYTTVQHLENVIPRCEVFPGDFVIAKMMPAGRTIIVPDLGTRITLGSDAMRLVPSNMICKEFLLYAMNSNVFIDQVYAEAHGITRVRTTLTGVKSYILPLPPLEEQKRIVERIEMLLKLNDELKLRVV